MYSQIKQCLPFCSNSVKMKIYCRFTIHCIDWIKSQEKLPKKAHPLIVWILGPLLLSRFILSPWLICNHAWPLVLGSVKGKRSPHLWFQWAQDRACISTAPFEHLLLPYTSPFRKHICKIQWFFSSFFFFVFVFVLFSFFLVFFFRGGRDKGWGGWCGSQN